MKKLIWAEIVDTRTIKLVFDEDLGIGEDPGIRLLIDEKEADYVLAMESVRSRVVKLIPETEIGEDVVGKVKLVQSEEEIFAYPTDVLDEFTPDEDIELGAVYSKEGTSFRLWSPVASSVRLLLFRDWRGEEPDEVFEMERRENGIWEIEVKRDLDGWFYLYEIERFGKSVRTVDIYSKSVSINGEKSAVLNLEKTDPEGWERDVPPALENPTDAVVYEVHVADITAFDDEIPGNLRGKFLGMVAGGKATKHLIDLGVTHVQLMPVMIFRSCEEDDDSCYNWGYDPYLYMVPSGKYSTDPRDPRVRVRELKELIMKLHKMGMRVILDVVFPHTFDIGEKSPFDATVPYYYYRVKDGEYVDETGCGNTTATERKMMRKLVLDALEYWVREYHVDGFRFDQMGVMDPSLVEEIPKKLKKIKPSILLYGEPWGAGTTRIFKGDQKGKGFGVFNDDFRDSIRGSVYDVQKKGFVMAESGTERRLAVGLLGSPSYLGGFTLYPFESVNYVECHDNHTLWDKNLLAARSDSRNWTEEELKRAQKLAGGLTILSLGVPFLHLGQDFCRTKKFNPNSYNAPLDVNGIDWKRKDEFRDVYEYHRGLIELRREHPAFRANDPDEIREKSKLLRVEKLFVAVYFGYHLNDDPWKEIFVIANGSLDGRKYHLPEGSWNLVVDGERAGVETLRKVKGSVKLEPISMVVLWR